MENRSLMPYSSEYFEPVRNGGLTAQGFVGIFEKANSDLGGQKVMCFREWVVLVGNYFYGQQIDRFAKKGKFGGKLFWGEQKAIFSFQKVSQRGEPLRISSTKRRSYCARICRYF